MVYFDNNATTPLGVNALRSYKLSLEQDWYNPSSPNRSSARAKAILEKTRSEFGDFFGLKKEDVIFTSGATESNNSVFAHFGRCMKQKSDCLVSTFEHSSIIEPAKLWFKNRIHYLPMNSQGMIDLDLTEQILDNRNISLVSLMAAHNETGILNPWQEMALLCASKGIHFHCDATQWMGKLPVADFSLCTSFSVSAHKFSGPKGIGLLAGSAPVQMQLGGGQENSYRAGTENLPAIVSMLTAWRSVETNLTDLATRSKWRDQFEDQLKKIIPKVRILGKSYTRLWNTSLILLPKFDNLSWVGKLDKIGFVVGTGAACSSSKLENSSISESLELSKSESRRLVRVSSYIDQNQNDWQNLAFAFGRVQEELLIESENSPVLSLGEN